jgi:hypothetical protein
MTKPGKDQTNVIVKAEDRRAAWSKDLDIKTQIPSTEVFYLPLCIPKFDF